MMDLRTDLFKTLPREVTSTIAVRDTLTFPDATQDVLYFDAVHCQKGKFGIGWHILVTLDGTVELGRDIETIGAHSKRLNEESVAVALVGGKDENGYRAYTRTPEQEEALEDILEVLRSLYPYAGVHDEPRSEDTRHP